MSFVANPQPACDPAPEIAGDGWWPDVKLCDFLEQMRIPGSVAPARATGAVTQAMLAVAEQLAEWRAAQEAAGFASLESVPAPRFGEDSTVELLWRRAIFSTAAADLVDTHGEISATKDGRDRREQEADSAAEHRRNATHAVRALQGKRRNRVRLL